MDTTYNHNHEREPIDFFFLIFINITFIYYAEVMNLKKKKAT